MTRPASGGLEDLEGPLAADRRWRRLLAAGGLPAICALWAIGLVEAAAAVADDRDRHTAHRFAPPRRITLSSAGPEPGLAEPEPPGAVQ